MCVVSVIREHNGSNQIRGHMITTDGGVITGNGTSWAVTVYRCVASVVTK